MKKLLKAAVAVSVALSCTPAFADKNDKKIKANPNKIKDKPKIPHMGWNSINIKAVPDLYKGINTEMGFYFIHTYYIELEKEENCMTTTVYGEEFVSAIHRDNIYATQYHPEKSHSNGIQLLKNFSEL